MVEIRNQYILMQCVVIDRFRENHEMEVTADVRIIDGQIGRCQVIYELNLSTEQVTIPGDRGSLLNDQASRKGVDLE
jgi:hypothetical protein